MNQWSPLTCLYNFIPQAKIMRPSPLILNELTNIASKILCIRFYRALILNELTKLYHGVLFHMQIN